MSDQFVLNIEKCSHPFCRGCITQYVLQKIEDGLEILKKGGHVDFKIKCPKTDGENPCFDQEIEPEVFFEILYQK